MRIGDLNKRIDVQAQTKVPDGMGGFTTTWVSMLTPGTTIAAAIWPVSAFETVQANSTTMIISHKIRIRYRAGIRSGWRIVHAGKNYDIKGSIDLNMAHRWLDVLCKEAA
jgi:SPP1 family predicted phage head-tail adaptor